MVYGHKNNDTDILKILKRAVLHFVPAVDHKFERIPEGLCNPLTTNDEVGNQIILMKSTDPVAHSFRNLLHSEKFDLALSVHGGGFYMSYPTSNVNEEAKKLFQAFSARYYEKSDRLHTFEHDEDPCDFTPNLHKKAVFERIYHEFDVPIVSNIVKYSKVNEKLILDFVNFRLKLTSVAALIHRPQNCQHCGGRILKVLKISFRLLIKDLSFKL